MAMNSMDDAPQARVCVYTVGWNVSAKRLIIL